VGEPVTLITHLLVREDAHVLYGFLRERDRALFRDLLKVTGVGAKMALAILSGMDAQRFAQCVEQEDITASAACPASARRPPSAGHGDEGPRRRPRAVGRHRAARPPDRGARRRRRCPSADAVSALVALGYKPADANRMARAADDGAETSEEIIRAAAPYPSPDGGGSPRVAVAPLRVVLRRVDAAAGAGRGRWRAGRSRAGPAPTPRSRSRWH
jgi:Holliday junction DNA helicase RuvA